MIPRIAFTGFLHYFCTFSVGCWSIAVLEVQSLPNNSIFTILESGLSDVYNPTGQESTPVNRCLRIYHLKFSVNDELSPATCIMTNL